MLFSVMDRKATFSAADVVFRLTEGYKLDGATNIIDMSWWQDPALIDYAELATQIDGVILRLAYSSYVDTRFETHYKNFSDQGTPIGGYHYITGHKAVSAQVNTVKAAAPGYEMNLEYWSDVEDTRPGTALYKDFVIAYMGEAESALQRLFGIYTSISKWDTIMRTSLFADRPLWAAHYTNALIPLIPRTGGWKKHKYHQFTDRSRFDGYRSGVDNSRYNGSEQEFYLNELGIQTGGDPVSAEELYAILNDLTKLVANRIDQNEVWATSTLKKIADIQEKLR